MDWTLLQITGLIVLGWCVLAVVVAVGLSVFMRGAHHLEHQLPARRNAVREWVRRRKSRRAA